MIMTVLGFSLLVVLHCTDGTICLGSAKHATYSHMLCCTYQAPISEC